MNILKRFLSKGHSPRILLVSPPFQRLRGMLSNELPLGLLYLSAVLKKNGFETKVLNLEEGSLYEDLQAGYERAFKSYQKYMENRENYSHPAWKEFGDFLGGYKPDIIGFSVMTPSYPLALIMASFAKQYSDALVVFGGPHPTLCPEDVAQSPYVDAVVVGEGEIAFLELVKGFRSMDKGFLRLTPSVVFREDGKIVANPLQPLIKNLDELPYPDYTSLVRPEKADLIDRLGVMVSRGCPYRCAFCVDNLIWRKQSRFRLSVNVLEEIMFLSKNYNLRTLFFQQDSFLNRKDLAKSVALGIKNAGLDISWWCAARADQIDEDLLKVSKESGLTTVILGIESGSQRILDLMNKRITLSQIERAVTILKKNGITTSAFFMIGVPDEDEADIKKTMSFMEKLPLDFISLSVFTPLPGSVLFTRCIESGLITKDIEWSKFDYQSPENFFSLSIRKERFKELVEELSVFVDDLNRRRSSPPA